LTAHPTGAFAADAIDVIPMIADMRLVLRIKRVFMSPPPR
jgi:hypothetical protein